LAAKARLDDSATVQPGDLVSKKYRLRQRLAEGGMGEVWAARHVRTDRDVAVKVLLKSLASNPEALARFVQEARATGRLDHPSLVQVFDAGLTADGRPYLVMELLDGESLEARLHRQRRLSELSTCVILSQVADAVAMAHGAGIVHRDLTSANVFLATSVQGGEPTPKILDFGISKVLRRRGEGWVRTEDGALLGSPAFMSPEQAEGAECADERTDVWSLGVLLYLCICGRTPFCARNHNTLMLAVMTKPHSPLLRWVPRADTELNDLAEACLIKDRDHRLAAAAEFAERLRAVGRRLAQSHDELHFAPRRRMTDRFPSERTASSAARRARVRMVSRRCRTGAVRGSRLPGRSWSRGALAAAAGLSGTAVGLIVGVCMATPSSPPASARELMGPAATASGSAVARAKRLEFAVRRTAAEAKGRPPADAGELDLARAVARGLGLGQRKRRRPRGRR
jgi:serine/threonine protein kinase